ncbi:hypothetical protein IMZ31_20720 (plasmid) [Pontibacillus sp. ALD_SL1]|uniref:hypothetical protein n=1 Tax=Pontibacillus sp. ALD_SL1 TaxID=2777185 RepID=UPI001A96CF0B|nr:hypothetical protein [Pontibacillus sp. ALD_SL1]QST02973.1 hypothetical protein IMZ31_20720 [Pontibacillus sp. ALD_SL1]
MFENRILSEYEKTKLTDGEREVVATYERVTGLSFMRHDVLILKKLIKTATPKQITATIYRMHKLYPQNFTSFFYVKQPVENMFKNRRGGKSNAKKAK